MPKMTGPCFILISAHYQQFLEINPARFLGLIRFVKGTKLTFSNVAPTTEFDEQS